MMISWLSSLLISPRRRRTRGTRRRPFSVLVTSTILVLLSSDDILGGTGIIVSAQAEESKTSWGDKNSTDAGATAGSGNKSNVLLSSDELSAALASKCFAELSSLLSCVDAMCSSERCDAVEEKEDPPISSSLWRENGSKNIPSQQETTTTTCQAFETEFCGIIGNFEACCQDCLWPTKVYHECVVLAMKEELGCDLSSSCEDHDLFVSTLLQEEEENEEELPGRSGEVREPYEDQLHTNDEGIHLGTSSSPPSPTLDAVNEAVSATSSEPPGGQGKEQTAMPSVESTEDSTFPLSTSDSFSFDDYEEEEAEEDFLSTVFPVSSSSVPAFTKRGIPFSAVFGIENVSVTSTVGDAWFVTILDIASWMALLFPSCIMVVCLLAY